MIERRLLSRPVLFLASLICAQVCVVQAVWGFSNSESLPCLSNGHLDEGVVIENGKCKGDSVFFYEIRSGSWSSNGIQGGAKTDIELYFGSMNKPVDRALDPLNYGLAIPPGGSLIMSFSQHFLIDHEAVEPLPNDIVELGSGPQNRIWGVTCPHLNSRAKDVTCGEWVSSFHDGDSRQIKISAPVAGIKGTRYDKIGIKYAGVHPDVDTGSSLYRNADGYCKSTEGQPVPTYCTLGPGQCPSGDFCLDVPLTASVTVAVVDSANNVIHMARREVTFQTERTYSVFPTTYGLQNDMEPAEMIDFTRVPEATPVFAGALKRHGEYFSSPTPYAARFVIFSPNSPTNAYPHPGPDDIGANIRFGGDKAVIRSNGETIGTVEIIGPFQWAEAFLKSPAENAIGGTDPKLGGTLFAIGVGIEYGFPGVYTVRITMIDGAVAESRILAEGPPTPSPTSAPSSAPSNSREPSLFPTVTPSQSPSKFPSQNPTSAPSWNPSAAPSGAPSLEPSKSPTLSPSELPSSTPSNEPSPLPTISPSRRPSSSPSSFPSNYPSRNPSSTPTTLPTSAPSTWPSSKQSSFPSAKPSASMNDLASLVPSQRPSSDPSSKPSSIPTKTPTENPTISPTRSPSTRPTKSPSLSPFQKPSRIPSRQPILQPINSPTSLPTTASPTRIPSTPLMKRPTLSPTQKPSRTPSRQPTLQPIESPTSLPTTASPTRIPSTPLTKSLTLSLTQKPSRIPPRRPTLQPIEFPTLPTKLSSSLPIHSPTLVPSSALTGGSTSIPSSSVASKQNGTPSFEPSTASAAASPSTSSELLTAAPISRPTGLFPSNLTSGPAAVPTFIFTVSPAKFQTVVPTESIFSQQSKIPSASLSTKPSQSFTRSPVERPTDSPSWTPGQSTALPSAFSFPSPSSQNSNSPTFPPVRFSTTPSLLPLQPPINLPINMPSRAPNPALFDSLEGSNIPAVPLSAAPSSPSLLLNGISPVPSKLQLSGPSTPPGNFPNFSPSASVSSTSQPLGDDVATEPTMPMDIMPTVIPTAIPSENEPLVEPPHNWNAQPTIPVAEISSGTVDPAKDTATPTPSLNQGQDWLPEKDREEPAQSGVPYSVNAFSGENDELGYTPAIDVPPAQDPETVSQLSGSRPGNKVGRRRERKVLLTAGLLGAVIGLGVLLALFTTLSQRACNQGPKRQ